MRQAMRNMVKVLDIPKSALTIFDLNPGEMFAYEDSVAPINVYMKLDGAGAGAGAVYLNTGMYYLIKPDAALRRVHSIEISS